MADDDLFSVLPPKFPLPPTAYDGTDQAEAARDEWWWSCAMQAIDYLARSGFEFTSEDLHADEIALPEPRTPAQYGAVFRAACRAGTIEAVGARQSTTPSRRGGLTRVWVGTGEAV